MTALEDTLTRLNQALGDFIALLEEEAVALAAQNPDRLSELVGKRNATYKALAIQWLKLAEMTGTPSLRSLDDLKKKLFATTRPPASWQTLEEQVHKAERLNKVNGQLIQEQMQRTQAALQVLQNSLVNRGIYGADGRLNDFSSRNRQIDSA